MHSVRQSCRPKHQVLILKCYPRFQKGVHEVKPNSSELSYLLYYVSTRRTKLQKVGAFLEKRAASDVWRGRIGNVQVTLRILTALIEKLPRDLPLYALSVLTVIETVLHSNDISMVEETISTFDTLCLHQDTAALMAEQEFANQYRNIVQIYASFASPNSGLQTKTSLSPPIAMRWRNAGLNAIKSVVSAQGSSAESGKQLGIVIPVILQNLNCEGNDGLVSLQMRAQSSEKTEREHHRRRRTSTVTVQTVDTIQGNVASASGSAADADKAAEVEARVLALRCLERIFVTGGNKTHLRRAARLVLQFIVTRHHIVDISRAETNGDWATSLIELIAEWCPVQSRFVILITALESLLDTPISGNNLEQHVSLAFMIDWLLKSPINMIGLSVMDVLFGLIQHILNLLESDSINSADRPQSRPISGKSAEKCVNHVANATLKTNRILRSTNNTALSNVLSPLQGRLLTLLQQCIGDLATHIYYADQVSDMIRSILLRIKPSVVSDIFRDTAIGHVSEATVANTNQPEDQKVEGCFYSATARIIALKSIKNILVVSNLRKALAGAGVESRNKVGVQVWDRTQWLLRDANRGVRCTYADAFVSWLQLETDKSDLLVRDPTRKLSRSLSKRAATETTEKVTKRHVSGTSMKEKSWIVQSNFLERLHLAIYDNIMESPTIQSDILLLHLLLINLIENLGVNALRFGLPMILNLQDDLATAEALSASIAQVNIGSLVYGYFAALSEKFDFEASKVGSEIHGEISRRRQRGLWLEKVRLPPLSLDQISHTLDGEVIGQGLEPRDILVPFISTEGLVQEIEIGYNATLVSPPQSPPSSPGRGLGCYPFGQGHLNVLSAKLTQQDTLPADIREQLLSTWSREACLISLEKEGTKTSSLSGSRTATVSRRNLSQPNGAGGSSSSPEHQAQGVHGLGSSGSLHKNRRLSSAEESHTPITSSSRDSTLRVNDLRRVLSVATSADFRRSSPLRGRLDFSPVSLMSLSSESMASGAFSASDAGDPISSRSQSLQDGINKGDSESPEVFAEEFTDADLDDSTPLAQVDSNGIPPVPPLPPGFSIPGGFPTDSASGSSRLSPTPSLVLDRPSTAPAPRRRSSAKGKQDPLSGPSQSRSLGGRKSRSINNLSGAGLATRKAVYDDNDHGYNDFQDEYRRDSVMFASSRRASRRLNIEKFLEEILPNDRDDEADDTLSIGAPAQSSGPSYSMPAVLGVDRLRGSESIRVKDGRKPAGVGRPPY